MWPPILILVAALCASPVGENDVTTDASQGERVVQASGEPACPELRRCRSPLPSIGTRSNRTVFRAVRWDQDEVTLQYNGDGSASIDSWSICAGPDRCADLPTLTLSSRITVHLTASGANTSRHIYLGADGLDLGRSGELALFRTNDPGLFGAETIEAFVRWGTVAESNTNVAHAAQIWPTTEFVEVCAEADGFIANGIVFAPAGYHAQPASCFR